LTSINDLKADSKNARKRTNQSATLIQESLQRYGAARSIVIDENDVVLAGNGTLEGAKSAGITKVRVIEATGDELIAVRRTDLSDSEKVGLALADNRTAELSAWDNEMLHRLSMDNDISPWFEKEDLSALLGEATEKIAPEDFDELDDDITTEHRCPSCGYEWSGKTR
jgi:rubrerythrin